MVVALDVNPGGRALTHGYLGLAEIVPDDQVGEVLELRFARPVSRLHDGRPGDVSEFVAAWTFVEAFIAGRPVVVSNAAYDLAALRKLLTAAGMEPPPLAVSDLLAIRRSVAPSLGRGSVWAAVRALGLMTLEEQHPRVEAGRSRPFPAERGTASDDALMAALVLVGLAGRVGCSPVELLSRFRPLTLGS